MQGHDTVQKSDMQGSCSYSASVVGSLTGMDLGRSVIVGKMNGNYLLEIREMQ